MAKKISIAFICKATFQDGLGHFIRSKTLANAISNQYNSIQINFFLKSDFLTAKDFEDSTFGFKIFSPKEKFRTNKFFDIVIFDLLSISRKEFFVFKKSGTKCISISPVFDKMNYCDHLISRCKDDKNIFKNSVPKISAGINYSIIRSDCLQIPTKIYNKNLKLEYLHIAISMGGTDPTNKTLKIVKELSKLKIKTMLWILIGQGYNHSIKEIINTTKNNAKNEIVIAQTNKNMWQILENCNLAIISGGITSYECAFSRLPSINYIDNSERAYLVKELEVKGLCMKICYNINEIKNQIIKISSNKNRLLETHKNCKAIFRKNPINNVIKVILPEC